MKPITLTPAQLDAALITVVRPPDLCDRCDAPAVDARTLRSGRTATGADVPLCADCAADWDEAEERHALEAHDPLACP